VFGFVVANSEKLTDEQRIRYRAVYCGLCDDLGHDRGFSYRLALTYDLVFLAIVLSAAEGEEYSERIGKCPVYPTKKRKYLRNKYTAYAADMNIALAYYKFLDDWHDDRSYKALMMAKKLQKETQRIAKKYPRQCSVAEKCLKELSDIEKNNVLIPDVPAAVFGKLLGSVFACTDDPLKSYLYDFGFALGKFIYILDAAEDLKSDIRKKSYNPFIRYSINDIEPILHMTMAECVEKYRALPVKQDREIIENILFSGIWTSYESGKKGNRR